MSHRQKSKHKSRHHTHAVKPNLQRIPLPPYVDPNAPKAEAISEPAVGVSEVPAQPEAVTA